MRDDQIYYNCAITFASSATISFPTIDRYDFPTIFPTIKERGSFVTEHGTRKRCSPTMYDSTCSNVDTFLSDILVFQMIRFCYS